MKFLLMTIFYALAVSVGDEVELLGFLNGRGSANFTRRANNIIEVLSKGTKASVAQTQVLPSGNTALRVEVSEGSLKGRKFWIYFNKKNPLVKLVDKNAKETKTPEHATSAETIDEVSAVRDVNQPEEAMISAMQAAGTKVQTMTTSGKKSADCMDCKIHVSDLELRRPVKDRNDNPSSDKSCPSYGRVQACSKSGSPPFDFFSFDTYKSGVKGRTWRYVYDNLARQDMHLHITDAFDGRISTLQEKMIYFFPRTYLPKYEMKGDHIITTLPTGEKVEYDSSGKIVGGVLSESAPSAGTSPMINYSGAGVTVKVSAKGKDPRLNDSSVEIAKGSKVCTVSKNEIWPDQSGDSYLQFKFPSDSEFNSFVQRRCGFSFL